MDSASTVALIQTVPALLVIIVLAMLILIYRKAIARVIIPRLAGVKILGVELVLLRKDVDEAAANATASIPGLSVSEDDKLSALTRAQNISQVIRGSRILWVDDYPQGNWALIKILFKLGADVDQANNTKEAIRLLKANNYDVVISDIARPEGKKAGLDMLEIMAKDTKIFRRTIFYVMSLRAEPIENAFAITNRPDHLLHFLMDALERERWQSI